MPIHSDRSPTGTIGARGFTLIELMITVSVAVILIALGVPAFNSFVMNDRDITQINSLVASFNYARSEAIKQHLSSGVQVCPSTNGSTCSLTSKWACGWIVWNTDPSLNTNANPALNSQAILQSVPAFSGSNTVTATLAGAAGTTFQYNGTVTSPVAITICDSRGATYARDVEVNATGRVASSQTPGLSVSGAALTCPAAPTTCP
jgi:type IV fimbrial biogenesis protein FimT